jgi:hypothetical protein
MIFLFIKIKEKYSADESHWLNTHIIYSNDLRYISWIEIEEFVSDHIPKGWTMEDFKWQMVSDQ